MEYHTEDGRAIIPWREELLESLRVFVGLSNLEVTTATAPNSVVAGMELVDMNKRLLRLEASHAVRSFISAVDGLRQVINFAAPLNVLSDIRVGCKPVYLGTEFRYFLGLSDILRSDINELALQVKNSIHEIAVSDVRCETQD